MACLLSYTVAACHRHLRKHKNSSSSSKHSGRLLSSLAASTDPFATTHVIRKFVASSSKSTALQTLSLLLSLSSPLSFLVSLQISPNFSTTISTNITLSRWFILFTVDLPKNQQGPMVQLDPQAHRRAYLRTRIQWPILRSPRAGS